MKYIERFFWAVLIIGPMASLAWHLSYVPDAIIIQYFDTNNVWHSYRSQAWTVTWDGPDRLYDVAVSQDLVSWNHIQTSNHFLYLPSPTNTPYFFKIE